MGVHAGFEIGHPFRSANDRVVNRSHRTTDDEVRAQVVDAIGLNNPIFNGLPLDAQVELLNHWVLQVVIDDVHAFGRSGTGYDRAYESIRQRRRSGDEFSVGTDERSTANTNVDGQRTAIEPAFERKDLQGHAIIVDSISPVNTHTTGLIGPVEANPRPEIVRILMPVTVKERQEDRVDLVVVANVIDVGIEFVA